MNSTDFPKAAFTGIITDPKAVNFKKDGTYNVTVEGSLTMRGKEQKVTAPATIIVTGSTIKATSSFNVKLTDYAIDGPAVGAGKVSKEPKITVTAELN
jgi:polyisoprenoid-binding protein YceI